MSQDTSTYTEGRRPRFDVLGVKIDAVNMGTAVAQLENWVERRDQTRYVTFTNVHSVMEARSDGEFSKVLSSAAMVCPDGKPLSWIGKHTKSNVQQVCGPELMDKFLSRTAHRGYSHYFYGGAPDVVRKLAARVSLQYPGVRIAGYYSPPFRPMTKHEQAAAVDVINEACPDVLWVGLGCPKQERWMHQNRESLRVPVVLGVGQAFDIYAGTLAQAPRWMRQHGFEWLFRLVTEPKRLWRRYLRTNSLFLISLATSYIGRHLTHANRPKAISYSEYN